MTQNEYPYEISKLSLYHGMDIDIYTRCVEKCIQLEAANLADIYGADPYRTIAVLRYLAHECPHMLMCQDDLEDFPADCASIDFAQVEIRRALEFLPWSQVFNLVENAGWRQIGYRCELVDSMSYENLFHHTVSELQHLTQHYIAHLEANRSNLIKTGSSDACYGPFPFVDGFLRCLYPKVRKYTPLLLWELDIQAAGESSPQCLPMQKTGGISVKQNLIQDEARLVGLREKLFDLRLRVLRQLSSSISSGDADALWESCMALLINNLSAEEVDFCLRLDEWHSGQTMLDLNVNSIIGDNHSGGLSDLISVIGLYELELRSNMGTEMRTLLDDLIATDSSGCPRLTVENYYDAVAQKKDRMIPQAGERFATYGGIEKAFWPSYASKANLTLGNEFYDTVEIQVKVKRKLKHRYLPFATDLCELTARHIELTGELPKLQASQTSGLCVDLSHSGNAPALNANTDETSEQSFQHNKDYRSVKFGLEEYFLTPLQAAFIQALHEAHLRGESGLSKMALFVRVGEVIGDPTVGGRITDVFRSNDTGRNLYRRVRNGFYCINL